MKPAPRTQQGHHTGRGMGMRRGMVSGTDKWADEDGCAARHEVERRAETNAAAAGSRTWSPPSAQSTCPLLLRHRRGLPAPRGVRLRFVVGFEGLGVGASVTHAALLCSGGNRGGCCGARHT